MAMTEQQKPIEYIGSGKWVAGKKQYKCRECKEPIAIGERHWTEYGTADDMFHPDRYCAHCATRVQEGVDYHTWPRETHLWAWAAPEGK